MRSAVFLLIYFCRIAYSCSPCTCGEWNWSGIWANLKIGDCRDIPTLKTVPKSLDRDIGGLILSGHSVTRLEENDFSLYKNLQVIFAVNNSISSLHKNVLKGTNLKYIYLGGNNISELPTELLHYTPNLTLFRVNKNKISKLQNNLFANLLFLKEIFLFENEISVVEERCFVNLPSLEEVHLQFNLLKTLNLNLENFPKLESFYLHNNPWHCDDSLCKIITNINHRKLLDDNKETTCSSPEHLNGKMWNQLQLKDFYPSVFPVISDDINEDDHLILHCQYCFISNITWSLNNRVIAHRYYKHSQIISTLTLHNVRKEESGKYSCIVEDCENCVDASVNITIKQQTQPNENESISTEEVENIFEEFSYTILSSSSTCIAVNIILCLLPITFML